MYFEIGCVDGKTYRGEDIDINDVNNQIAEQNGYVGNGDWADIKFENAEHAIEHVTRMLIYDSRYSNQTFSMGLADGRGEVTFNVQHVVWWRVVR